MATKPFAQVVNLLQDDMVVLPKDATLLRAYGNGAGGPELSLTDHTGSAMVDLVNLGGGSSDLVVELELNAHLKAGQALNASVGRWVLIFG